MTASVLCVGAGGKGGISFGESPVWASVKHHVLISTLAITAQVTRKVIYLLRVSLLKKGIINKDRKMKLAIYRTVLAHSWCSTNMLFITFLV